MRNWSSSLAIAGALMLLPTLALAGVECGCPPSTADRIVGLFTLTNIMYTAGAIFGAACIAVLIYHLWDALKSIPFIVYEAVGYGLSAYCVYLATTYAGGMHSGLLLLGSLLFGGMLMISGTVRRVVKNETLFFFTLFVVWAGIAWWFQDEYVGFIAIMALMGSLGFSAGVMPGIGFCMGFDSEGALGRATSAAFVILALFVLDRILMPASVLHVKIFEPGALWMGSFVGYLGLLIMSWSGYRGSYPWPLRQIVTIFFGVLAIVVGSVFQIPQLLGIGGTFFALYAIEKPFEIAKESIIGTAFIGLCVCIFLWFAAGWIEHHRDVIGPYLLF